MKKLLLFWSFTALCLPLPSLADDVYKWVDAEGKVHYGDSKQVDAAKNAGAAEAEKIDIQDANAYNSDEAMTDEMRAALKKAEEERLAREAKQRQERADAAARNAARPEEPEDDDDDWADYGLYYQYPYMNGQRRPMGPVTPGLKPNRPDRPVKPDRPSQRPRPTPHR